MGTLPSGALDMSTGVAPGRHPLFHHHLGGGGQVVPDRRRRLAASGDRAVGTCAFLLPHIGENQ